MRQNRDNAKRYLRAVLTYHDRSQRLRTEQRAAFEHLISQTHQELWLTYASLGLTPVAAYNRWCAVVVQTLKRLDGEGQSMSHLHGAHMPHFSGGRIDGHRVRCEGCRETFMAVKVEDTLDSPEWHLHARLMQHGLDGLRVTA